MNQFYIIFMLILNILAIDIVGAKTSSEDQLPNVDIYRTDQIAVSDIYKTFGSELKAISTIILSPQSLNSKKNKILLDDNINKIITGIKKKGDFVYVNLSSILYPQDQKVYFSIDVVDRNDKDRLSHFLPLQQNKIDDPDHLIAQWRAYETTGFELLYQKKQLPIYKSCPVYHCVFGFEDEKLKKYKNLFNTLVPKNKSKLRKILRYDKSAEKRGAAVYLVGHLNNAEEIIDILVPSIFDSSSLVRNNAMRVLIQVLMKVKPRHFPIENVVKVLDFPTSTDRNKGLVMLSLLVNFDSYAKYISTHAADQLLRCLRLTQPNIHNPAYEILKKISGKSFSDKDYAKWQQWIESQERAA